MSDWSRVQPAVCAAGDVGGDAQVGEAWSARWVRALSDGTFGVVDRAFYVAEVDGGFPYVERRTEYLICTDPTDPGSSERWSDAVYDTVDGEASDDLAYWAARHAEGPSVSEWVAVIPWVEAA